MTHTGLLLDWVGNPDSTGETNTSSISSSVYKILPRLLIIFLALSSLVVSAIFETFGVIEKLMRLMASPIIANLLINIMFLLPPPHACFNVLHLVSIWYQPKYSKVAGTVSLFRIPTFDNEL